MLKLILWCIFFIHLSCSLHTWLYINVYCIPDRNRLGISLCIWVLNFHYVYVVCCLIIVVHARIMARIRVLLVCLALLLLWIVDCWKLLFHLLTIIPTLTPFRILSVTQWNVSGKKSVKHWVAAACVLFCNPVVMCNSWILWMSVVAKLAIMGLEYYSSVLQVDLQLANSQNGHHFFFYSKSHFLLYFKLLTTEPYSGWEHGIIPKADAGWRSMSLPLRQHVNV